MRGYDGNYFGSGDSITGAQLLARMARQLKGYGLEPPARPQSIAPAFTDVPDYAAADVALVARLGLISGYSEQKFGSWAAAQRAHVAPAMSRYLDLPAVGPAD